VTAVHAVEVAKGKHRLRPARRLLILREMDDVHALIVGKRDSCRLRSRPSLANDAGQAGRANT